MTVDRRSGTTPSHPKWRKRNLRSACKLTVLVEGSPGQVFQIVMRVKCSLFEKAKSHLGIRAVIILQHNLLRTDILTRANNCHSHNRPRSNTSKNFDPEAIELLPLPLNTKSSNPNTTLASFPVSRPQKRLKACRVVQRNPLRFVVVLLSLSVP